MAESLQHVPGMRLLAYCLMPNHWHLLLWPRADGELSDFGHYLALTHTQRWHAHYHHLADHEQEHYWRFPSMLSRFCMPRIFLLLCSVATTLSITAFGGERPSRPGPKQAISGDDLDWLFQYFKDSPDIRLIAAVEAIGDERYTRSGVLGQLENVVAEFPNTPESRRAMTFIERLAPMVEEDRHYRRKSAIELRQMAERARVVELIFALRDHKGGGRTSQTAPAKADDVNPFLELVQLGFAAVSQLIESLDDRRLTRCVTRSRGEIYILTVRDCVVEILEWIAARNLRENSRCRDDYVLDEDMDAVRKTILAWWRCVERQGEKKTLIRGVRTGDHNAISQASRLILIAPKEAIEAIDVALSCSPTPTSRRRMQLLETSAQADRKYSRRLLDRFIADEELSVRIVACKYLAQMGSKEPLRVLCKELGATNTKTHWGFGETLRVIELAFDSDDIESINSISGRLSQVPAWFRMNAIDIALFKTLTKTTSQSMLIALEDFLISLLADEQRVDAFGGSGSRTYSSVRVCDLACGALARCWRCPELFDVFEPVEVRNASRERLKVVARERKRVRQGFSADLPGHHKPAEAKPSDVPLGLSLGMSRQQALERLKGKSVGKIEIGGISMCIVSPEQITLLFSAGRLFRVEKPAKP